jgi:VanZ family protein
MSSAQSSSCAAPPALRFRADRASPADHELDLSINKGGALEQSGGSNSRGEVSRARPVVGSACWGCYRRLMLTLSRPVLLKLVAWSCVVALGVLSLLPSVNVKRTGFSGHFEHFVAYLLTAGIFCLAYRSRRPSVRIAIGLAAAAALFEIGQYFSSGRTPALADWVASTTGVLAGGLTGLLVARLLPSRDS